MKTLQERFEGKHIPEPNSGCWLWFGSSGSGNYGQINHKGKVLGAHRVSWELYNGPIPEGLCVLHKCDTPCCVNPAHLFLGTHKDNKQDSINKGRFYTQGEKNGNAKLNQRQVETIRLLLSFGVKPIDIAERFNVSPTVISRIKTGKSWRNL